MADYLNGIVYISTDNYATLKTNGILTANGQTYTYDPNALYITTDETPATYVHNIKIYNDGSASGSCEFYTTIYSDRSTAYTIDEIVATYNMGNKLTVNGIVSNSNGTTAVGNVWFANTTEAYFNNSSEICTGSSLHIEDTIVGKLYN